MRFKSQQSVFLAEYLYFVVCSVRRCIAKLTVLISSNIINLGLILCLITFCLLLFGDIEENPGPVNGRATSTIDTSLSILHLNIRSLRNKIEDIASIVEDFDIVCFTETHLYHSVLHYRVLV